MNQIKHLLDVVDEVRDHVALGLMSDPGLSKTSQVKQWAEEHDRAYCELIISQRMPSEISGIPMPISESKTMEVFDYNTLLELKDGDVLAFDEFTNGNIQTLNACLTLIQERTMLSGRKLPSLLIVAMGNPQGRCELLPQTKQRFLWVNVKWSPDTWKDYMKDRWDIVVESKVVDLIGQQYREGFGNAITWNYLTPRTVENLFRMAQKVEQTDVFWEAANLPAGLIPAIYKSMDNVSLFSKIKPQLEEWATNLVSQDTEDVARVDFADGLASCNSMDEVRSFITQEYTITNFETILPDFIEFLRASSLDSGKTEGRKIDMSSTSREMPPGHKSVLNPTMRPGRRVW